MFFTYKYFVSFKHTKGFGNAVFFTKYKLNNFDNIIKLEHEITENQQMEDKVIITNWRLLSIKLSFR